MIDQANAQISTVYRELPKPKKDITCGEKPKISHGVVDRDEHLDDALALMRWADDGGQNSSTSKL